MASRRSSRTSWRHSERGGAGPAARHKTSVRRGTPAVPATAAKSGTGRGRRITRAGSQGGAQDEGGAQGGGGADGPSFTIALVPHAAAGVAFWDRVRIGAEHAAAQLNVDLEYAGDVEAPNQATLVQNAIDRQVDGLAVTLAFPDAVGPVAARAAEVGIPVVALNAGMDVYQDYGASMFFGSDEAIAGESAGQRIAEEGGAKVLCVIHEEGNVSLETRCSGVRSGFPSTENLQVDGADLPSTRQTIEAKLQQDPSITHVVTLDAGIADAAVEERGANDELKIVTFDLSTEVVSAIQEGDIDFSVDQQPYLQGYLAVHALWTNLTNGNDIGGGRPVLTGPSFVDSSNVESIAEYAGNGTR